MPAGGHTNPIFHQIIIKYPKYLLNDVCVLEGKPLVYGSLYKFDGYAATFNLKTPEGNSANLRDFFPEPPKNQIPRCT